MLRGAVASIVAVAQVLAAQDPCPWSQAVGDGAVGEVQVNLVGLIVGIVQHDVVGAAGTAVGAAVARINNRTGFGGQERKVPGIGEIVGVLAIGCITGRVAQFGDRLKVTDRALQPARCASSVRQVITGEGLCYRAVESNETPAGAGLCSSGSIPSGKAASVSSQPGSPGSSTCQPSAERRARASPGSVASRRPESSRSANHRTAVFPSGLVKAVSSSGVNRLRVSDWAAGAACSLLEKAAERSAWISGGSRSGRGIACGRL